MDPKKLSYSRNLWRRFSKNFLTYGYSQIVSLAVQFLTVPFFLNYWNKERYAEWLLLSGVPTMLGLLDFGVTHATASKAILLAAQSDINGVRRSFQTGTTFSICVALIILAMVAMTGTVLDWAILLKLPSLSKSQAQQVLLLLTAHLGTQLLGGPLNAWFMAMDRAATGYFLLANRRLLDVVLTITVLALGGNALQLATCLLTGQIVMLIVFIGYARSVSPWPILGLRYSSLDEFRSIIKPAIGHVGITIGNVLTLQGGLQILNQIAPVSIVVLYSVTRTLMRLLLQIGVVANNALRPELSRLLGTGQTLFAKTFTKRITIISLFIISTTYAILIFTGPSFINWWSSDKVTASYGELALMGLHTLINAAWFVPASYAMAGNQHTKISMIYLSGSVFGIFYWILNLNTSNPLIVAAIALSIPEIFAFFFLLSTTSPKKIFFLE